jgi:acetylornithine/N-succinyldiaminopimelate aminotransferase
MDGFDQVPYGDLAAVRKSIGPETAGILIEPIQGEGGLRPAEPDYLRGLREICDERGLLLIFDEIQTGIGRTGKLFAHEWAGVQPDIMAIAKGIGGGFPMGACLATAKAARGMTAGTHGSTFGGNPLAMAVGNAVLETVLAPGFLEHVQAMGNYLRQQLAGLMGDYPSVFTQMRGQGLMIGLKLGVPNGEFVAELRDRGMLAIPAGDNVVRLLPPLIIEESHVREAMDALSQTAKAFAAKTEAA